jgi:hypothetical protein
MENANWPTHKITFILQLAAWVLDNSYVTFDGKTYKQDHGTAMGTPFAVTYTEIYMHVHECIANTKFISMHVHPP